MVNMKFVLFILGVGLLINSFLRLFPGFVDSNVLILFSLLILLAFFEELEEFNFLGIKGKKTEKWLRDLLKEVDTKKRVTVLSKLENSNFSKKRSKSLNLLGLDRSNLLAIIFEIERLLRIVYGVFYAEESIHNLSFSDTVLALRKKGYLTKEGVEKLKALNQVRDFIIQGDLKLSNQHELNEWLDLADETHREIYADLSAKKLLQKLS